MGDQAVEEHSGTGSASLHGRTRSASAEAEDYAELHLSGLRSRPLGRVCDPQNPVGWRKAGKERSERDWAPCAGREDGSRSQTPWGGASGQRGLAFGDAVGGAQQPDLRQVERNEDHTGILATTRRPLDRTQVPWNTGQLGEQS